MMNYLPNPKALVYSEIEFISVAGSQKKGVVSFDVDRLFDEVSAEIQTLFLGGVIELEVRWNGAVPAPNAGVEVAG